MNRAAILEPGHEHRVQTRCAPWSIAGWLVAMLLGAGCLDVLGLDIPVPVPARCGDRMIDTSMGEQCDHGGASATCDDDCTPALCGDGRLNASAGEQCDDAGESVRCNEDCTLARCGDGIVNTVAGEACDDAIASPRCDRDCSAAECGDGVTNAAAGEACDDAEGLASGACTAICQPARCGDGFLLPGVEICDDGNDDQTDFCTATCKVADCGDGLHNGEETDLDCGGPCDSACRSGQGCAADSDCFSGMCSMGRCVADRLATGRHHTCVLLEGGAVRCWGLNDAGQLGYEHRDRIGDDEAPSSAGDVPVIQGRAVQLAAGDSHTCALREDGTVQCWGGGAAPPMGHERAVQIAARSGYTCAVLEAGAVQCSEEYGGLLDVGGRVAEIAAGAEHTCALLERGTIRCWGNNSEGQLGYGYSRHVSAGEVASAGDVVVGGRVVQVAAGREHTCALREDGRVLCWGENEKGQLGYGHTNLIGNDELPISAGDVDLGGRAMQIAAGRDHTCALLEDGGIRCWGLNDSGQLGHGNTHRGGAYGTPGSVDVVDVGGRAVQIATSGQHTCVLLEDGNIRCWGPNWAGQLGYGNTRDVGNNEVPGSVDPVSYR